MNPVPKRSDTLLYSQRDIGGWSVPTLEFTRPARDSLFLTVLGIIGNSITTSESGRARTASWKIQVASEVKAVRGVEPWEPNHEYAISLAMRFHGRSHGNRSLDVENFIKPVLDAVAAGLFCSPETDPCAIERWDFDDSNFKTLLIHRLPDTGVARGEGAAIFISSR